jgi:hypothetical protein
MDVHLFTLWWCWQNLAFRPPSSVMYFLYNVQGDKKSLFTWWLQYRKLHVMFIVSPARPQTFLTYRTLFSKARNILSKNPVIYVEVGITGQIDRPFLARNSALPSLMSHDMERLWIWRAELKGGAQRACSYRPRCDGVVAPWPRPQSTSTSTHIPSPQSFF